MSVFKVNKGSHLEAPMFFGEPVDVARYEEVRYPVIDKLIEKQLSFFWIPDEVDVSKDRLDFAELSEAEEHIFTSNLKRQILLDSIQGRSVNLSLLPIVSLPEVETWIENWGMNETIHSRSYTHMIRNVYPNPSLVFDDMKTIPQILECADDISKYYDALIDHNANYQLHGHSSKAAAYEHKKSLWLGLNAINVLEGVRFYVSFACSWAFAELKKMEGNAKIIKFIARDENVHLAASQHMLKLLAAEDGDYAKIKEECHDDVIAMFESAVQQEREWAQYLFKDGSIIGLNEKLLCDYIEWIGAKRLRALGYKSPWTVSKTNPLPWTEKWISGGDVQVAPQETEITSYIIGGIDQDVDDDTFKGMSLDD